MSKVFFLKELVSNPFLDTKGRRIYFEPLAQDYGVTQLDSEADQDTIAALRAGIKNRTGGIYEITEGQYLEKKRTLPFQPFGPPSDQLRVFQQPGFKAPPENAPVTAEVNMPAVSAPPSNPIPNQAPQGPGATPAIKLRVGRPPKQQPTA